MKDTTLKFLDLFFEEGEQICVSDCQGGYHSVSQNLNQVTLKSPNPEKPDRTLYEDKINLVAINPVRGWRRDSNVTAYRSFLIELDDGKLHEQHMYVENMGMPYSICVFSGGKSLHFGIVLEDELPNESTWRFYNKWILNIMSKADQQTVNPTRSIRFPGNKRMETKQTQTLLDLNTRVKNEDLNIWLNKHPDCKPQPKKPTIRDTKPVVGMPNWVKTLLKGGVYEQRNATWFKIACTMGRGRDPEDVIAMLLPFFTEDDDFPYSEWEEVIFKANRTVNE